MAKGFALGGLLRLRQLQQDAAANALGAANHRQAESAARRARAGASLADSPAEASDARALAAVAAARASAATMLAELDEVGRAHGEAVEQAARELTEARRRATGLEKLAERHRLAVQAEALRAEQSVVDELAATAWHRGQQGGAR